MKDPYTLKIFVRKNLKMSSGKKAAQAVHAAIGLFKEYSHEYSRCIVLEVSDKKFNEAKKHFVFFCVRDAGRTEVEPGTETALAYWELDNEQ